jgi:hypothetical protein
MRRRHLLAAAAILAAVVVAAAGGQGAPLAGTVGPGFSIALADGQGNRIANLDPGSFELVVDDLSDEHNFHLSGPGVDVATDVGEIGKRTFSVTLQAGTYTFLCDPHAGRMRGSFTVGTPPPAAGGGSGSTTVPQASASVGARLVLVMGPGATISLRTLAGKRVTVLRAGAYTVVVRDRAPLHGVRLAGAGARVTTGKAFTGTRTLRLTLVRGTLVFRSDPVRPSLRGTVRVV